MKTYALFANKPDSADYCMGCCMESYPSDYIIERNLTEEALIERIAELDSKRLGRNESGYDFTWIEEPPPTEDDTEENRIRDLIHVRTKQLTEKREAAEEAEKEAKKTADRERAEARERAEFERLKSKFTP